jgi:hypothetical protein
MPARRLDPQRLVAAVSAQRAALGVEPWTGAVTVAALGAACLDGVIAAADRGLTPEREALRGAVIYSLGLLEARAPAGRSGSGCRRSARSVRRRSPAYQARRRTVETDRAHLARLATGRTDWPQARPAA